MLDSSLDVENNVFKAIVTMCSERILHRLGLIMGSKSRQRQSITEVLQIALDCLKRSSSPPSSFLEGGREVLKLADSWSKHQTQTRLEELVKGIYHLRLVGDLQSLIGNISNRDISPSSRTHLLNMITKVSRYREAARFLFRTAKKIPLARRIRLVFIQLPQEAFDRAPCNGYIPSLDSTITLLKGLKKGKRDLTKICRFLNSNEAEANHEFARQTQKTIRESKIHAEIQLLYYCESQIPSHRMPRVVCSSKKACWLCNEFILMHGKIHTPKCHGKVYPGWRLPALCGPLYDDFATRFNSRIQDQLKDSLHTLFIRRERTTYPDPYESSLNTLLWSGSTLSTLTPPPSEESIQDVGLPPAEELIVESAQPYIEEIGEALMEEEEIDVKATPTSGEITSDTPESLRRLAISETSSSPERVLTLDNGKIGSKWIGIGKTTRSYQTGPIDVQIEYTGSLDSEAADSQKKLSYTIEVLEPDDAARLQNQTDTTIIDVSLLEDEMDHNTDEDGCIYLANGDAVLKICMQPMATGTPCPTIPPPLG